MKIKECICLTIILLVFLFYLLTIRAGQPWPDDFAMYIGEAKNLTEHTPLSATGYIYNPHNPGVGPRLYPPVFPVLLVPAYVIGGLNNLTPMKVEIVLFFTALLIVLWRGLGRDLSLPYRVAGLVYLCYGTRTIGIILVPVLLFLAVMYWKRGGRSAAAAAVLGLVPCLIQRSFFGAEASYADQLELHFPKLAKSVLANVVTYGWSLSTFWENSYTKILRDVVLILVTLLAFVAYLRRIRTGPRIYEVFLPVYLGMVLLWPNPAGNRYLIPIFPLYIYYCLEGVETVKAWLQIRRTEPILIPLLSIIFLSYAAQFAHLDFAPFKEGVNKKEAGELFAYIKSNTHPKDVFVFRRPRALALFTGRSASVYPESQNEANFCRYFQTIGATYLIEAPALDDSSFDGFLAGEIPAKQLVFSNSDFRVFHVRPDDLRRCANLEVSANALTTAP